MLHSKAAPNDHARSHEFGHVYGLWGTVVIRVVGTLLLLLAFPSLWHARKRALDANAWEQPAALHTATCRRVCVQAASSSTCRYSLFRAGDSSAHGAGSTRYLVPSPGCTAVWSLPCILLL